MNQSLEIELMGKLGEGAYGSVYRAYTVAAGKIVAVDKDHLRELKRTSD